MPTTTRDKKLQDKRADQAALKKQKIIWIGIAATEENLQRIGALLLFADHLQPEEAPINLSGPMPWEDPKDPRFQKPPELEIDYAAVRREIGVVMGKLGVERRDEIVAAIQANGGTRISDVPQDRLLPLLDDLNRLNPETAA